MRGREFRRSALGEKAPKKHPSYWKVKAAFLEMSQTIAQAKADAIAAEAKFEEVMRAAGLDPRKIQYALDDASESITPKK